MLFEFIGMLAVCAVGIFFVFGGMLGSSMPALVGGAITFAIGVLLIVNKFITDVVTVPVKTYSMTLSIDNTTIITLAIVATILVISPKAIKIWLNRK